jgi:hypothetical protein
MHDYDNMPVLDWNEKDASIKARAQILHQEPVILQMPDDFDTTLDGSLYHCKLHEETGLLYDCDGDMLLRQLALQNNIPELALLSQAVVQSGSQVDVDSAHNRIIVHD